MTPAGKRTTPSLPELERASLDSPNRIVLLFREPIAKLPRIEKFRVIPAVPLLRIVREGRRRLRIDGGPFDIHTPYRITLPDKSSYPLLPDGILDRFGTTDPLGLVWEGDGCTLRLFAPRARRVDAFFYHTPGEEPFAEEALQQDTRSGCWSLHTEALKPGDLYGYRVRGAREAGELFDLVFADPYSLAVAKQMDWHRRSLSVVLAPDTLALPPPGHLSHQPRNRMVYEAHVRDATALFSSVAPALRGTYLGAVDSSPGGFLAHLRRIGMNTVEWLPLQDYDYFEPPYEKPSLSVNNHWNRYSRNHWGYMPAYYFAPEARYTLPVMPKEGSWIGRDAGAIHHVREMVGRLHDAGISVILDVVYNHIAQYGENPIRQIDPFYALRHDRDGKPLGRSGCGNELATERPMIRRLVVDSLKHWSRFYGFDGFRFDLAGLIDRGTLDAITDELRDEHPEIQLIAEPWGGDYDKERFTERGWASWNDLFRDSVRGADPRSDRGYVFGTGERNILTQVCGNLKLDGGPFYEEFHSVNYLACHDGYTLGDFLRIARVDVPPGKPVARESVRRMSDETAALLRFGLLVLFTSRGMVMLHAGDEWGRSKWIEPDQVEDPEAKRLDPDSYNKDNRTNWLDWSDLEIPDNAALTDYVAGLAELRRRHPALRLARRKNLQVLPESGGLRLGYHVRTGVDEVIVLLNADSKQEAVFTIPCCKWIVAASGRRADPEKGIGGVVETKLSVPPRSGAVLVPLTSLSD